MNQTQRVALLLALLAAVFGASAGDSTPNSSFTRVTYGVTARTSKPCARSAQSYLDHELVFAETTGCRQARSFISALPVSGTRPEDCRAAGGRAVGAGESDDQKRQIKTLRKDFAQLDFRIRRAPCGPALLCTSSRSC
jgi:hypothetical protein